MRLGRIASGPTPHLPALRTYAARAPLPTPPAHIDWGRNIGAWTMLANDRVGDCTIAGVMHYIQSAERWRDGVGRVPSEADAIAGYEQLGYDPARPETDTGARLSDVMQHWHQVGFPYLGSIDRILGFVRVDPSEIREALWLFGPLIIGADLPRAAQSPDAWVTPASLDGDAAPGSWGGHCMLQNVMAPDNSCDQVTWGGVRTADAGWQHAYVDELWAVLHPAWIASGASPSGWLAQALIDDMPSVAYGGA